MEFFRIDGFYNEDKFEFTGQLVCDMDESLCDDNDEPIDPKCPYVDDDVFFYGLSRKSAEDSINEEGCDFTITAVYDD